MAGMVFKHYGHDWHRLISGDKDPRFWYWRASEKLRKLTICFTELVSALITCSLRNIPMSYMQNCAVLSCLRCLNQRISVAAAAHSAREMNRRPVMEEPRADDLSYSRPYLAWFLA